MQGLSLNAIKLDAPSQSKWFDNLLVFLRPVVVLYVGTVIGIITLHNGAINLTDFIPTTFTMGGIVLYLLNAILDYFRKL